MSEITVRIQYYNVIRDATGCTGEPMAVREGTTPRDLIIRLCDRHPRLQGIALLSDGSIAPHLRVFINACLIRPEDLESPLQHGDEVMLFPAIAGG